MRTATDTRPARHDDDAPTRVAAGGARSLTGALLEAWETLRTASPVERAIGLLDAVWPEFGRAHWRRLSIGDRDACLFLLQSSLFGGDLKTVAACPACGERLESAFHVDDVCAAPRHWPQPREPLELQDARWRVHYRLPCSDDLQALSARPSPDTHAGTGTGSDVSVDEDADPVAALLRRCVIAVERDGQALAPTQLPDELRRRLGDAMAEHDPLADLRIGVACPACGHAWSASLDIVAYLWDELDDWAQDLLADVHVIARHYAWSERDILALSPLRRRYYLDLLQA